MTAFDPLELDVLKEATNVGMGQAGQILSDLFERFVLLKVPQVEIVSPTLIKERLTHIPQEYKSIHVVRQTFIGALRGEIAFVFGSVSYALLSEMVGLTASDDMSNSAKNRLLVEISNSLGAACMTGIGEQLNLQVNMGPPTSLGLDLSKQRLFDVVFGSHELIWEHSLLMVIDFNLSDIEFQCKIVIMISEESFRSCKDALNGLLQ
jgi:chemotaxis protein CheC